MLLDDTPPGQLVRVLLFTLRTYTQQDNLYKALAMSLETIFDTEQQEIAYLCQKPLNATSPEELGELLEVCYNRLFALTHGSIPGKERKRPLSHVGVLGRLTLPTLHVNHFDFREPDLAIERLVWDVKITQYFDEEPNDDLFGKWFPYLDRGLRCGYGNARDSGNYEKVTQYLLKLSLFPNMLKAVQAYYALVQAPYSDNGESKRKRLYPGFTYLCGV